MDFILRSFKYHFIGLENWEREKAAGLVIIAVSGQAASELWCELPHLSSCGHVKSCCSQVGSKLSYSVSCRAGSDEWSVSRDYNSPFVKLWQCRELLQLIVQSVFSIAAASIDSQLL